jgi:CheY-like chemotaxis protein
MSRVLITDDSLLQRRMLTAIVSGEGHETQTATNGREALEIIQSQPPDCMLLDMLMPEMDGVQVLEALQSKGIKIPVIVLTADIQEWMQTKCLELGAQNFLNKPVKQDDLRAALKEALSQETTCT